jgi:hypothetical protein
MKPSVRRLRDARVSPLMPCPFFSTYRMAIAHRMFAAFALLVSISAPCAAQSPTNAGEWSGTWRGTLINLPTRPNAPAIEVTREIGTIPTTDSTCAALRTTYREGGAVRGVKEYKLCRGHGTDDWYVDEGGGLTLAARWLGDALISPFKYDSLLLISTMRLRDDVLEEEILTVTDRPAVQGPLSLTARGIQRLRMRRVSSNDQIAALQVGAFRFLLQMFYVAEHAGNFMMSLRVEDADVWWEHIQRREIPKHYAGILCRPPALQPRGIRVLDLSVPTGVLWHITDARQG